MNPTTIAYPGQRQGLECSTPICSIGKIYSFCQSPNYLTGPTGYGYYNVDGPGPVATPGTEQFANACPHAYSYSKDDAMKYTSESKVINVTSRLNGLIWGYPGGSADPTDRNNAKPQAALAGFTIGLNDWDYHYISNAVVSLVGYNLALKINPTIIVSTGERSGLECEMRYPFVLNQQHFYLLPAS
jgi:hypothetical protein